MFNVKKRILTAVFICVFCLILLSTITPVVEVPLLYIARLPLALLVSVKHEFDAVIFYRRNYVENDSLRKENSGLKRSLLEANEVYLENNRLRELLSFKRKAGYRLIPAHAIASSPENLSNTVLIDKGRSSGIRKGLVVVTNLGLVGRVTEVTGSLAKVTLLSDPGLSVSATVQRSRQEGLISGGLNNSLQMKYLPQDADIRVSDVIITSGLTEIFPKGIFIGTVTEIGEDLSGLSRYAVVKPAVNLSNLEEVLVIVP